MDKSVLLNNGKVIITLIIDDADMARIELQSTKKGPDLTQLEDVIVVVDGKGVEVVSHDAKNATAQLGPWAPLEETGFQLMIRVANMLEAWDFDGKDAPPREDDEEEDEVSEAGENDTDDEEEQG
jgi:intracellular sulfur oxidation DsrE/DsrF family protein